MVVTSRAQEVADELETEVLASGAKTGERIGLRTELIERFKVSPSVMNEALRILRDRDLVRVKPGAHGGIFVGNPAAQVRLGGIDLWFRQLPIDPKSLFEARAFLEDMFVAAALGRATPEDARSMDWAMDELRASTSDPRRLIEATMRLHLSIARASRIDLLVSFYESIISVLSASLVRASFVLGADHDDMLRHTLEVHGGIVQAIRDQDLDALEKLLPMHRQDLVRTSNPLRSPDVG